MSFIDRYVAAGIFFVVALISLIYSGAMLCFEIQAEPIRLSNHRYMGTTSHDEAARAVELRSQFEDWSMVPGIASASQLLVVESADGGAGAWQRFLDTVKALEVQPTSGRLWLNYATLAHDLRFDDAITMRALKMALIVERREAETVFNAALITITLWRSAGADMQEKSISAIWDMQPHLERAQRETLNAVLEKAEPEIRDKVVGRLATKFGGESIFSHWVRN